MKKVALLQIWMTEVRDYGDEEELRMALTVAIAVIQRQTYQLEDALAEDLKQWGEGSDDQTD